MICPECNQPTHRLIIRWGRKACANCLGVAESAGVRIDGTLTRSSDRVREQQLRHEGDMITAHVIDNNTKQLVPNPEFIRMHPDKIATSYSAAELKKAGHSKIDKVFKHHKETKARHDAAQSAGITYRTTPS